MSADESQASLSTAAQLFRLPSTVVMQSNCCYFGKLTIIWVTTGFAARNLVPLESSDRSGVSSSSKALLSGSRSSIPTRAPSTQPPDTGGVEAAHEPIGDRAAVVAFKIVQFEWSAVKALEFDK
jgi:hypothetical protein